MKAIIIAAAMQAGVPGQLLSAICWVESSHRALVVHMNDRGKRHSHGLCQLQTSTARMMGFNGPVAELYSPRINAKYAARYLSHQLNRYEGDWADAVAAYNAGSVIKSDTEEYINADYVKKVFRALGDRR